MKVVRQAWIACVVLGVSGVAFGQAGSSSGASVSNGVPLVQLIESVGKKTGKRFVVDPRVTGDAGLSGADASKLTYSDLLSVLQVHGFAAIDNGGFVRIVPDSIGRTAPSPLIDANDKRADAEIVTRVFRVKSLPATYLVPILRALLPQSAHLAAMSCTNELLLVDTFGNVRRIEAIVAAMDKGETLALPKCEIREPSFGAAPGPAPAPAQPAK